jgi:NAD(P)-dependent dehydrogenase (short-subunit alcohol dehydrogenase family)
MKRLTQHVAIVTGGAGGIGAATAQLFCEHGASVALVDLPDSPLQEVAASIRDAVPDAQVLCIPLDLGQESAAREAVRQTLQQWGQLDVVVNNAGMRSYEPLAATTAEMWQRILSVNLLSYAYLAREALPSLRASANGNIVNIASTHAVHARAGMGQYDVTKAGIVSLTRTLAFEEAQHRVRVNAVCPGATLTPFHIKRAATANPSGVDLKNARFEQNLQKRWASPREIAYPILWLASPEASFVTGSSIMADGGTIA